MAAQLDQGNAAGRGESQQDVDSLMSALASADPVTRERARLALIEKGDEAVPALIDALTHPRTQTRWEAAKALVENSNPASASSLVRALEDTDAGVRWLAAEALIALQRDALAPLLHALIDRPDSPWLREGAHHVLHELMGGRCGNWLAPVLAALEDATPEEVVPLAAESALNALAD
jgi:HEAT repeat protein